MSHFVVAALSSAIQSMCTQRMTKISVLTEPDVPKLPTDVMFPLQINKLLFHQLTSVETESGETSNKHRDNKVFLCVEVQLVVLIGTEEFECAFGGGVSWLRGAGIDEYVL